VNLVLAVFASVRWRPARRLRADPDGRAPDRKLVARQCRHELRAGWASGCWSGRASTGCTTRGPTRASRISTTTTFAPVLRSGT
jgi:hypothetical protein